MLIGRLVTAAVAVLTIAGTAGCSSVGRPVETAPEEPALSKVAATSSAAPAEPDGEVYALGVGADPAGRTVTFDEIEWFSGKAALAACKADKQEIPPAAWCNDYYYRNPDVRKRTVGVADSAAISVADYFSEETPVPQKTAGLRELDERLTEGETIVVVTVRDGVITGLREQFTP